MFEDILTEGSKPFVFGPSYIHVMYFKDGEVYEYEANINSKELLDALPLFPPPNLDRTRPEEFIEFIKAHLLLEKCLLMESNVV
jgi:hypothetical protein